MALCEMMFSQNVTHLCFLSDTLKETSGLINLNGRLITHNDSESEAALYEIDTVSGHVLRQTTISNVSNTDWESITIDDNYIYIGDFGNNFGNRTDLKFYRISINDYLTTTTDSVQADSILFNYADQTDFSTTQFSTNFDAEACFVAGDSIYIFTKNWGDYHTNVYRLSNGPGNHSAVKIDSLNVQGLITGASYNAIDATVVLTGYTFSAFAVKLSGLSIPDFSGANPIRTDLSVQYSFQIEGITEVGSGVYYITAEDHISGQQSLYRLTDILSLDMTDENSSATTMVYPNPAKHTVYIQTTGKLKRTEVYDLQGRLIFSGTTDEIDVSRWNPGMYFVHVFEENLNRLFTTRVIIE